MISHQPLNLLINRQTTEIKEISLFHPFAKFIHIYSRKYNPITNQSN